ncbi:ABH_G0047640.mRNA.1.CDS.1 [Saccharomyces cerevisiae]|nr:ABH_G0047640.mRNA.1.CDS.1 [Saccharomyces cerevisiae]CAI6872518.1 ABH_G0047640.mRNA.1.CDS.1 [Saccharomyces cerevisiae]
MIQSLAAINRDNYFSFTTVLDAVHVYLLWGAASSAIAALLCLPPTCVTKQLWPQGSSHRHYFSGGAGNCMAAFVYYVSSFFVATTWAGGCYFIVSETFPLRVKSRGNGNRNSCKLDLSFLHLLSFAPFLTGALTVTSGSLFLGCLVLHTFMSFFVPETKGLTLEEVNTIWLEGVPAWKSASWVPPERRTADYDADLIDHDDRPI